METVRAGSGIEAQARASQEEHPSQCHFPACFAQNSCFCWRSEVVLSNSAGITNFDIITNVKIPSDVMIYCIFMRFALTPQ